MSGSSPWSEAESRLLRALLDRLVPASADGRVPAAGALGTAGYLAERASADPSLAALFRHALAHAAALAAARGADFDALDADSRDAVVEALERDAPEAFAALVRHTYMGYYSRPDVRPLFGLSPRPTQPGGYDVPADDAGEMAALLAPVRARGRRYRPA